MPRRSAGGHHILLWVAAAVGVVLIVAVLALGARELVRAWYP